MEVVTSAVTWLSELLRPYSFQVATAIVATLLFVYGESINRRIRNQLRGRPFVFRVTVFIAICAFGYGALTVAAAAIISRFLFRLSPLALAPTALLAFVIVGVIAERERKI